MAETRTHNEIGPTGRNVGENVRRVRLARGWTTTRLAEEVREQGIAMGASTVTKIEKQDRRVTVDELAAFAVVLQVSPATLLLPFKDTGQPVPITDRTALPWDSAWRWLHGEVPMEGDDAQGFIRENRPYEGPVSAEVKRFVASRVPDRPYELRLMGFANGRPDSVSLHIGDLDVAGGEGG